MGRTLKLKTLSARAHIIFDRCTITLHVNRCLLIEKTIHSVTDIVRSLSIRYSQDHPATSMTLRRVEHTFEGMQFRIYEGIRWRRLMQQLSVTNPCWRQISSPASRATAVEERRATSYSPILPDQTPLPMPTLRFLFLSQPPCPATLC
jgi:hypothetical protein